MQRSKEQLERHHLGEQGEALLKKENIVSERFGHAACHSILAFFGEQALGAVMPLEVASMSALGALLGVYMCGKRGFRVADELDAAILRHDIAFEAAYGGAVDEYVPKFHFTKHIPEQLRKDGFLQDCFATERKNSLVLRLTGRGTCSEHVDV